MYDLIVVTECAMHIDRLNYIEQGVTLRTFISTVVCQMIADCRHLQYVITRREKDYPELLALIS